MFSCTFSLLFASAALAHSGLKTIVIDGTTYPPFESRIDNLLGNVRRIEWSHDVLVTAFNPITNISDPGLACQPNPRAPLLKAVARAGSRVTFNWTPLVRMHSGPIMAYLGLLPTPNTSPNDVKFFKIWEKGFDISKDEWANQIAVDNGDTYTVQLPSDIKSGTYVLRTELLALHGNMQNLANGALAGPQFYPYCFNVEVINGGSATPDGVKFPGAYKATDFGIAFAPYQSYTDENGKEQNSKYIPPGPPVYAGKYDEPKGPVPVVKETGYYTGIVRAKYDALVGKLAASGGKLSTFVNKAWPHYVPDQKEFAKYPDMVKEAGKERRVILSKDLDDLKAEIERTHANDPPK